MAALSQLMLRYSAKSTRKTITVQAPGPTMREKRTVCRWRSRCDIDSDGEDNGITAGDVGVISNPKGRADFHGAFGLVLAEIPNRQRWSVRCAGQVLDVSHVAEELDESGSNLRLALQNLEFEEVRAVVMLNQERGDRVLELGPSSSRDGGRVPWPPDQSLRNKKRAQGAQRCRGVHEELVALIDALTS